MSYRTPHWLMMLRVLRVSWGVVLILLLMIGAPIVIPFIIVAVSVFGLMMFIGAIVKAFGWVEFGDDPDYQKARASGWHPYFDLLPPGINNDSLAVRAGGIPEPKTDFVPPEDWLRQCQRCGARNQTCSPECWHCKATFIEPNTVVENNLPRHTDCPWCGKLVTENKFGDMDSGMDCPFCGKSIKTAAEQSVLRVFNCSSCGKALTELVAGTWDTGITCFYCSAFNINKPNQTLPMNP